MGIRYVGVPLAPDFSLMRSLLAAIRSTPGAHLYRLSEQPTGNLFDADAIRLDRGVAGAGGG
jgi:hypothetical protein